MNLTINDLKVLSVLSHGEKYGLEIMKEVKEREGGKLNLGSLYNVMNRLERKGFVKSKWGEETSGRGGNRRKYYKITGAGEAALNQQKGFFKRIWGFGYG